MKRSSFAIKTASHRLAVKKRRPVTTLFTDRYRLECKNAVLPLPDRTIIRYQGDERIYRSLMKGIILDLSSEIEFIVRRDPIELHYRQGSLGRNA